MVARLLIDGEGEVAHSQTGMTALRKVGPRPAEELHQEQIQVTFGVFKTVRIHRAQYRIVLDGIVEGVDDGGYGFLSAD